MLAWPSKSQDLNPIENVWHLLKNQVRKKFPKDIDSLEKIVYEEWDKLNDEIVSNIACSFNVRTRTLHNRKGATWNMLWCNNTLFSKCKAHNTLITTSHLKISH